MSKLLILPKVVGDVPKKSPEQNYKGQGIYTFSFEKMSKLLILPKIIGDSSKRFRAKLKRGRKYIFSFEKMSKLLRLPKVVGDSPKEYQAKLQSTSNLYLFL